MKIPDIGHPKGLKPKAEFIPEIGEDCVNLDGVIEIARREDTPQAKAIYKAFRKRHAQMRLVASDRSPEQIRGDAIIAALEDCGHKINFISVGTKKP